MSKAYKVTKRTVMFDKENPKTVYSVVPVSYGILTTEDVAKQIAAESASTPGDVKNVLDRYAYYVKENIKKGYTIELLGMGYLGIRFITSGTGKSEKEATAKLIQSLVPSFNPSFQIVERYTKGLFCRIGFNKQEILFDRGDRAGGETKWNYRSLFNLAIEGITSFTTAPLRIATFIGIVVAIWALCYMVWIISKVLIWGDPVAGYPTIMTVMLFIGAVQLICIGILGEYVGRIFNETKNRPTYLIKQVKGVNNGIKK